MRAIGEAMVLLQDLKRIVEASSRELEHLETQAERDQHREQLVDGINELADILNKGVE